ncbi:MAG: patatin family protein [Granulosicoccus sp.]
MNGTTAIVLEGGGQRGIYTAGVLDAFMAASFNPFDTGVGVSAGAQNLLAYILQQPGYARRAIMELTTRPEFLVMHRCLMSGNILDLDGYFETSMKVPEYQLPYHRVATVAGQTEFAVVATDSNSLDAVYLKPGPATVMNYIKASSAVPILYRPGVIVKGQTLIDGGIADPLPVRYAYEQGARRIVVIRTARLLSAGQVRSPRRGLLERTWHLPITPPRVKRMFRRRDKAMRESLDFLERPPDDLQLHIVAPRFALKSREFCSRTEHMMEDYEQGTEDGVRSIRALESWSTEKSEVTQQPEISA